MYLSSIASSYTRLGSSGSGWACELRCVASRPPSLTHFDVPSGATSVIFTWKYAVSAVEEM